MLQRDPVGIEVSNKWEMKFSFHPVFELTLFPTQLCDLPRGRSTSNDNRCPYLENTILSI